MIIYFMGLGKILFLIMEVIKMKISQDNLKQTISGRRNSLFDSHHCNTIDINTIGVVT